VDCTPIFTSVNLPFDFHLADETFLHLDTAVTAHDLVITRLKLDGSDVITANHAVDFLFFFFLFNTENNRFVVNIFNPRIEDDIIDTQFLNN
jgi:hypothetical protein